MRGLEALLQGFDLTNRQIQSSCERFIVVLRTRSRVNPAKNGQVHVSLKLIVESIRISDHEIVEEADRVEL